MPKVLNVEKLDHKFASLTRSRESIQGLSSWIMKHKEFYKEIVQQWFVGLAKDFNALTMFYVANDVIQNCGKKRVPEYREAFSKVLDKALRLEKVKEIKKEVTRLLTLWKERGIYDDEFTAKLQNLLESEEIKEPVTIKKVESSDEDDEKNSELEIIARYKQHKLIHDLHKLKDAESKREEKEEILNYAEEPELPEIDELIVRRECQDMLKKCDTFLNLVEESIQVTDYEIMLRKSVLRDLKDSCVFHAAQSRDVKKVASVFRAYGNKVKLMEKKVSEKITMMQSPAHNDSPCFSQESSPLRTRSPTPSDNDSIGLSKREQVENPSSGQETLNPVPALEGHQMKNFFDTLKGNTKSSGSVDTLFTKEQLQQESITSLITSEQFESLSNLLNNISANRSDNPFVLESNTELCGPGENIPGLTFLSSSCQDLTVPQTNESLQYSQSTPFMENEMKQQIITSHQELKNSSDQPTNPLDQSTERQLHQEKEITDQQMKNSSHTETNLSDLKIDISSKKSTMENQDLNINRAPQKLMKENPDLKVDIVSKKSLKESSNLEMDNSSRKAIKDSSNLKMDTAPNESSNLATDISSRKAIKDSSDLKMDTVPNGSSDLETERKATKRSLNLKTGDSLIREISVVKTEPMSESDSSVKKETKKLSKSTEDGIDNEVDFLLEEAYDTKKAKNKLSIKRKIEMLLNSKGKKQCKDSPPILEPPSNTSIAISEVKTLDDLKENEAAQCKGGKDNQTVEISEGDNSNKILTNNSATPEKMALTTNVGTSENLSEDKSHNVINNLTETDLAFNSNGTFIGQLDLPLSNISPDVLKNVSNKTNPNLNIDFNEQKELGLKLSDLNASANTDSEQNKVDHNIDPDTLLRIKEDPDKMQIGCNSEVYKSTKLPLSLALNSKTIIPTAVKNEVEKLYTEGSNPTEKCVMISEKPKLLHTLESVLEHMAKSKLSADVNQELGPKIPFENCLKLFSILRYSDTIFHTDTSILNSTIPINNSASDDKETSSKYSVKDNFEVVDMECDTDEEHPS